MKNLELLIVFGTRPEAIKMAPVILRAKQSRYINVKVCTSGQHREMLDQVLDFFGIQPDFELDIMKEGQTVEDVTVNVLCELGKVFTSYRPDIVLVHGDTTTTMAAALAAYYKKIDVGHVEAGLRSWNIYSPYPEEMNRSIVGKIARYHFAPTEVSKGNLIAENVANQKIIVTGNTVIDALLLARDRLLNDGQNALNRQFQFLDDSKKMILVTGHRRENFGAGIENLFWALVDIVANHKDVEILFPVHLNPNVNGPIQKLHQCIEESLKARLHLVTPVNYQSFIYLMQRSHFIISDSGGVQEEGPALGKPVLVTRETTERPEAIEAGVCKLVGSDRHDIYRSAHRLLTDRLFYAEMSSAKNPYGDGTASEKIVSFLEGAQN